MLRIIRRILSILDLEGKVVISPFNNSKDVAEIFYPRNPSKILLFNHKGPEVLEVAKIKKYPKVSVIIPTYKRPKYLRRAIDSVLSQSYKNIELIVVDDNNSGDKYRIETENLMNDYNDKRIQYIKHEKNKNGSAARNTGIKYSQGEYIAFLDDDDEFLSDKIENQVIKMEQLDHSWGACYTSYRKINKNNKIQYGYEKRQGNLLTEALMRSLYIQAGSNLFVRKTVLNEVKGFDESFTRNQDLELLVKILEKYKIAHVDSCSLIIHYEVREIKRSYEDINKIDEHYLNKFQKTIEKLSENDKYRVYKMIALDNFRKSITDRKILKGLESLSKNKVSLFTTIRYLFYLLNRVITRRSYGFKL
jgi:glycosyltransferase involved in cell wall biosynthesis